MINPIDVKQPFIFLQLFLWIAVTSYGQEVSLLEYLKDSPSTDIYLSVDWKSLIRDKADKVYQQADILIVRNQIDSIPLPVRVKTRGNMRLQVCKYPPLKLKFRKNDLAHFGFNDLNEMDIVYPCKNGKTFEQYILKEYLAYQLHHLISPYGFQTRLVRFHYLDTEGNEFEEPAYAFLVENTEETVSRLNGRRIKTSIISENAVEQDGALNMFLFQFMIGNTDWNIQNRHNLDFLALPGHDLLLPIPYDFDYAGLVGTPYAVPHPSLKLPSVNIRYYQGECYAMEEVEEQLQIFREMKDKILQTPEQIAGLSGKSIQQTQDYLEAFFDIIEHPKKLKNQIVRHCGLWPMRNN